MSYTGSQAGNGIFGQGEKWEKPKPDNRRRWVIVIASTLVLGGLLVFLITRWKRLAIPAGTAIEPDVELSPREREIFDLLLTKLSTKEIAGKLDLTYSGANFHYQILYNKLGVQNRTELFTKFIKKP